MLLKILLSERPCEARSAIQQLYDAANLGAASSHEVVVSRQQLFQDAGVSCLSVPSPGPGPGPGPGRVVAGGVTLPTLVENVEDLLQDARQVPQVAGRSKQVSGASLYAL